MQITGTEFNYFLICHRKLWLFSRGITMESESDQVMEGRLIHEESYPRRSEDFREIEIDGIKIDFFDARNNMIHEIKKSDRFETAHAWQLKYYIHILTSHGLENVKGILEYPRMKKTEEVILTESDKKTVMNYLEEIQHIILGTECPERKKFASCKNCSYIEFCWSTESEES